MQRFDLKIQSLIFPGNKAIVQNDLDNYKDYAAPEQNYCRIFF